MDNKLNLSIKRAMAYVFIIGLFTNVISQNNQDISMGQNELKLNVLSTIAGYFEVNYDYILNEDSSIGISGGFSFDEDIEYDFIIFPNYRFFFGRKPAAGFFIETNLAFFSQEKQVPTFFGTTNANNGKSHIGFGPGLAVGGKFMSKKSGFVGELLLGVGRNLINTDVIDSALPRIGISIGKRF